MADSTSSISLKDSLEAYIKTDTGPWAAYSKSLSETAGAWAADCLESTKAADVAADVSLDANEIGDGLLAMFLDPRFTAELHGGYVRNGSVEDKSEARVRSDLTEHILNHLCSIYLATEKVGPAVGADGRYLWYKLYALGSDDAWKTEAVFGQVAAHNLVHRVATITDNSKTGEEDREGQTGLVRLDLIDLALYKALIQHPELLKVLEWRTFEKLLADMLERFGYEIELQRGTKDGGVDLFAIKRNNAFGPERYLLQAKRWNHNVGVEPVRQLAFLHSHFRMSKSCLATTASFTKGAWELGYQYQWQLDLRDFHGIQRWVELASNKLIV